MCWNVGATTVMMVAGAAGAVVSARRGDPAAVPFALGWFALMEGLQLWGLAAIDACGTPANATVTYLSALHIAFQPLVINAFVMATVAPLRSARGRWAVLALSGAATAVILLQLYPFSWAGSCTPGVSLCAERLCTRSGTWHLAWDLPYNGLMTWFDQWTGLTVGFPSYVLAVFVLPLAYGAWRFVGFHLLAGPVLAGLMTADANEMPAIWCLFSIGILLVALVPGVRRLLTARRAVPA